MLITLNILEDYLAQNGFETEIRGEELFSFRRVHLLSGTTPRDDCLYLEKTEELPEGNKCVIDTDQKRWTLRCLDVQAVYELVSDCIAYYDNWDDTLRQCLISGGSIADLLNISRDIFNNPTHVDDTGFRMLAMVSGFDLSKFEDQEYIYMQEHGFHSPEYISNMLKSPVFRNSATIPKQARISKYNFLAHPNIITAISYEGNLLGFFTVIGIDNELNNAMIDLSNHFVSILALALLRERQSLMMTRTSLSNDFMCNILYGVVKEPEVIQSSFENAGIGKSSSYVVALFSANNTSADNDFFILRAHDHFSERIKNSCTVIDQDSIVLILADSPEKPAAESVLQVGSEFLKLSNARIGFSLAFENPVDTARFYLQAKAALRFGPLASPEESIFYHYGDVVLYDLIQHYGEAESLRTIMHPAILILQEYDEKHSVKLLPTLRVLLKNSNDTAVAAEELFLHRNTLYYRMKQISSITGIEFKDESSMEHLRISLLVNDILHQA